LVYYEEEEGEEEGEEKEKKKKKGRVTEWPHLSSYFIGTTVENTLFNKR
jgi:hypothetical protein